MQLLRSKLKHWASLVAFLNNPIACKLAKKFKMNSKYMNAEELQIKARVPVTSLVNYIKLLKLM